MLKPNPQILLYNSDNPASRIARTIWVTFARHGVHCYPDAPEEVAYLRSPHRHLFKFKVGLSVEHNDREVEFHMLQTWCADQYNDGVLELDHKSCEMIAEDLIYLLVGKYGLKRTYSVEVSEDGECGAVLTFEAIP